uniref:Uncharacterized protein n=1 Tax=Anguilla anguilla TaxID=7936 RepID=A0A0E9RJ91_ANGAN
MKVAPATSPSVRTCAALPSVRRLALPSKSKSPAHVFRSGFVLC